MKLMIEMKWNKYYCHLDRCIIVSSPIFTLKALCINYVNSLYLRFISILIKTSFQLTYYWIIWLNIVRMSRVS